MHSFAEMLSALVREQCDLFIQQENEEIARLRTEVAQLRAELTKVNPEVVASSKGNDAKDLEAKEQEVESLKVSRCTNGEQEVDGVTDCADDGANPIHCVSDVSVELENAGGLGGPGGPGGPRGPRGPGGPGGLGICKTSRSESAVRDVEPFDMKKIFSAFDHQRKGFIDFDLIITHMMRNISSEIERSQEMIRYRSAINRLNKDLGVYTTAVVQNKRYGRGHLSYAAFEVIMSEHPSVLKKKFGRAAGEALLEIRDCLVDDVIAEEISRAFGVCKQDLHATQRQEELGRTSIKKYLEPVLGFAVILNAFTIGIRLDVQPDWAGWFIIECCFSFVFMLEFIYRVRVDGCLGHFFGADWSWNWFDCIIVWSAIVDSVMTALEKLGIANDKGGAYYLLLLRLVRLLRITRILRVLRLRIFKDLALMVNGVIGGLYTLFWAIVLLSFLTYVIAVLMRQVIQPEAIPTCILQDCNRGQQNMDQYGHIMFGNVLRSMITMFTCFTEGCSSPDGTPFIWHLWDAQGSLMVLAYLAAFIFIQFGVFNLIMAVMVQNTIDRAAQWEGERQFGELSEHHKKAHKLRMLLNHLCRVHSLSHAERSQTGGVQVGWRKIFSNFARMMMRGDKWNITEDEDVRHLNLQVNQDQFEEILADQHVQEILDDLDISTASRGQLFDILDADLSGFVCVSELVDGLMRLRGPADKGDVIGISLIVRHLQRQVFKLEELIEADKSPTMLIQI